MAVTQETLRLLAAMRVTINAGVGQAERALALAWVRAWDRLAADWRSAAEAVVDAYADGARPTAYQIERLDRVQRALVATADELDRLRDLAVLTITDGAGDLIERTPAWLAEQMASQMPGVLDRAEVLAEFNRLDPESLRQVVLRTTEQVASAAWPLSQAALDAMYRGLISGIGLGDGPRQVARLLLRLEQGFNGGLARALNLARTEMLSAHRQAALIHSQANRDVLSGWRWQCALDKRSCASCISKHGTFYPIDDYGPSDHQQGRCSRVPVTKSWKELGIPNVIEPPSVFPDARKWFDGLPQTDRLRMFGAERLALLDAGLISWDDLAVLRTTTGWRDSFGVRPLRDLRLMARRAA